MKFLPVLLLLLTLFLAGCGQKGPLFLPGEAAQGNTNQFLDDTADAGNSGSADDVSNATSDHKDAQQAS